MAAGWTQYGDSFGFGQPPMPPPDGSYTGNTQAPGGMFGTGQPVQSGGMFGGLGAMGSSMNSAFGFGAPSGGYGMSSNPYMGGQADALRAQSNQAFNDMNQQIGGGAIASGGYGGSRMGVAQGVAMGRAQTGLDSSLANLYGSNWNNDQNRALSQYGMDQNFYSAQRGLDQTGAQTGANIYNMGVQGQWSPYQNFGNVLGGFSGNGTTTNTAGGGTNGALGGALSGASFGHQMGWW